VLGLVIQPFRAGIAMPDIAVATVPIGPKFYYPILRSLRTACFLGNILLNYTAAPTDFIYFLLPRVKPARPWLLYQTTGWIIVAESM